jgi:uncharacterized protein YprB with RNaseH-like and TPR domain/predicted nuclease with RNAse H fold
MIGNTFILIPGIGQKTEEILWRKGILTWNTLLQKTNFINIGGSRKRIIHDYLSRATKALCEKEGKFFTPLLPPSEYWRLYTEFIDKVVFLDIETTGLSLYYDSITMIGTYGGGQYKVFIRDINLEKIVDYLKNFEVIVTFNGKLFDVPFMRKEFPNLDIPPIHIDLRFLLRSLEIQGSLKEIEKKLDIPRSPDVEGIGSRDAAILWRRFLNGHNDDFQKLVLYNVYDVKNMQYLMNFCYTQKFKEIRQKIKGDIYQRRLFESEDNVIDDDLKIDINFETPQITLHNGKSSVIKTYLDNKLLISFDKTRIQRNKIYIDRYIQKIQKQGLIPVSLGIDLSASEKKESGLCVLSEKDAYVELVKTDEEIISKVLQVKPTIISIDSPLSLPKGRDCVEDSCACRMYGITRECERILKKRGINVYPCLIKSMQGLTMRGIKLTKIFEEKGFEVIESYPGAAQDILGIPRKKVNLKELEVDLTNLGIQIHSQNQVIAHDELDALTSSLVGYLYLAGSYEALGNIDEGYLIVPSFNGETNEKNQVEKCLLQ